MAKKIIIDVEVDSKSIDQAVAKAGELKKLSEKISIQYDIDGKPLDVVINKSLNLQQQVKALTAELRKTKEGTAEFTLLSNKLNDTKDNLGRVTAKSNEFFGTLSMLPGPVGEFSRQIQGGIDLLKTFSGFSLKDISNQFKGLGNDIKDIAKNLFGLNDAEAPIEGLKDSFGDLKDQLQEAANTAGSTAAGQDELANSLSETASKAEDAAIAAGSTAVAQDGLVKSTNNVANSVKNNINYFKEFTPEMIAAVDVQTKLSEKFNTTAVASNIAGSGFKQFTYSLKTATGETIILTEAEAALAIETGVLNGVTQTATKSTWLYNFATKTLGLSMETTAIAGRVLTAVLAGLGIGLLIAGIVYLITKVAEWTTSTEEADAANKALNETLKEQQRILENELKAVDAGTKLAVTRAKIAGMSEEEIFKIQQKGGKERLELLRKDDEALFDQQRLLAKKQGVYATLTEEQRLEKQKEFNERSLKNGQDITAQIMTNMQSELDESARVAEKRRAKQKEINQKIEQENKAHRDKIKQDNKSADDALYQLLQENASLKLKTERERQDQELKNARESEEKKIKELEISETRKGEILNQIAWKYYYKNQDLTKKRKEEDIQTNYEFVQKLADITIASYKDEVDREVEAREEKFRRDRDALEKDLNFIKMSEEAKAFYREQLVKAKEQDILKIKSDAKIKELDTELKFLEMTNEANKNSFKAYWDGRQQFLDLSKQRELAALDLTEAQKVAIEKKYAQLSKDLQKEKLNAYLGYLQAGLSAVQNVMSQQQQIVSLQQGNELDAMQIRYNKEKEIITRSNKTKEEQDKELLKSKEAFEREQDKVKEKYFYKNRDAQKSQAMISAFQAAISAYVSLAAIPVVGPFLGAAAAAVALAFGIKQANLIGQQQYVGADFSGYNQPAAGASASATSTEDKIKNYGVNYESGGMIGGNRHYEGGTMIEAEKGEAIMSRGSVTMFQPLLSMMNQMGGGTAFAPSLVSTSYDNPKVSNPAEENRPMIIKSYVVSGELTSEANKQARLKDLSTI